MHLRALLQALSHHLNPLIAGFLVCFSWLLLVRVYYQIKPITPRWLRVCLRRRRANRQRKKSFSVWPISEPAGKTPEGWQGWPDGRGFAFVLTHDVESQAGVDRVKPLAEVEMALGFRSSFNFIPEGPYRVQKELRDWLTDRGFEVGVHDHRHDGKLFRSRAGFKASALRINHYLKEWNAVGFRAGFMLRNLDWMQELEILYDTSTFDSDPFEPQPEGANTIFPFWIESLPGEGYVELPYTLAQDFSLFVVLQEQTTAIWTQKLEWIASRGGMALVDVHPDYIAFAERPGRYEYSAALYRSFLKHVKEKYSGRYWHALPRDVALFYRKMVAPVHRTTEINPVLGQPAIHSER